MGTSQPQNQNDYNLKIDAQVEKFIDLKQKLTYFLVTASVAIIAFLANFVYKSEPGRLVWFVIFSSIAGLFTSGFSLANLHMELESYRLHLECRYKKKSWDSLSKNKQTNWVRINKWASNFLNTAFVFLFIEIAIAVTFFILFFYFNKAIVPTE